MAQKPRESQRPAMREAFQILGMFILFLIIGVVIVVLNLTKPTAKVMERVLVVPTTSIIDAPDTSQSYKNKHLLDQRF